MYLYRSPFEQSLSDMTEPRQRDSVKYLEGEYRDLVERRHVAPSDDLGQDDNGDMLLGCHTA